MIKLKQKNEKPELQKVITKDTLYLYSDISSSLIPVKVETFYNQVETGLLSDQYAQNKIFTESDIEFKRAIAERLFENKVKFMLDIVVQATATSIRVISNSTNWDAYLNTHQLMKNMEDKYSILYNLTSYFSYLTAEKLIAYSIAISSELYNLINYNSSKERDYEEANKITLQFCDVLMASLLELKKTACDMYYEAGLSDEDNYIETSNLISDRNKLNRKDLVGDGDFINYNEYIKGCCPIKLKGNPTLDAVKLDGRVIIGNTIDANTFADAQFIENVFDAENFAKKCEGLGLKVTRF